MRVGVLNNKNYTIKSSIEENGKDQKKRWYGYLYVNIDHNRIQNHMHFCLKSPLGRPIYIHIYTYIYIYIYMYIYIYICICIYIDII
jgi:hypothetical protein